jgi:CO dehydrogenase nickel-insertion accessory protein CooC1
LLGELEGEGQIVVGDLEAGLGTMTRLQDGQADTVIVVAQPTAKALEVARRAIAIAAERVAQIIVIANRVRDDEDLAVIRAALGEHHELYVVPDDPAIAQADRDGLAPIDVAADAPGVRALVDLAAQLARRNSAA